MISLVTAIWGTLSGPLAEWGIKDVTVRLLGMKLNPVQREGRIIMLYHAIAMAVMAIEVYFITSIVQIKKHRQSIINATVTVGYLCTMIFGLGFAYFGYNWTFHGLFLFGLSLIFFSGILLAEALWPWRKEYRVSNLEYAHTKKGVDLERAVIGHLHIMLTLIAVAITLVVGRWFDFKGVFHKIAMPLMIIGIIIITIGVWIIVPYRPIAHTIIYVGSVFIMLAALMLVIYGWKKLIHDRLTEQGITKAGFWRSFKALLHDPIKFGPLWQMVFMNFTVSGVGIFMAAKLDEIFRVWPLREERIVLTGHWHVLAGIIATIIMMYYADIVGLKGKIRKWFGWILIIGSDIAFASATLFSLKRLFVKQYFQEPFTKWSMLFLEIGLASVLIILAMLLLWRLFDLFKKEGVWKKELISPKLEASKTTVLPGVSEEGKQ